MLDPGHGSSCDPQHDRSRFVGTRTQGNTALGSIHQASVRVWPDGLALALAMGTWRGVAPLMKAARPSLDRFQQSMLPVSSIGNSDRLDWMGPSQLFGDSNMDARSPQPATAVEKLLSIGETKLGASAFAVM